MKPFAVQSSIPVAKRVPEVQALDTEVAKTLKDSSEAISNAEIPDKSWYQYKPEIVEGKLKERVALVTKSEHDRLVRFLERLNTRFVESHRERSLRLYPKFNSSSTEDRVEGRYWDERAYHFSASGYNAVQLKVEYSRAVENGLTDYASRLVEWTELNPSKHDTKEVFKETWRTIEQDAIERLKLRDNASLTNALIRAISNVERAIDNLKL